MSELKLFNSLTRKKEGFKPQDPSRATMYTCGPTVYGPSHLGHARTYVSFDLLKRALEFSGYQVAHVLNITDVHDSMIAQAREEKTSIRQLANRYLKLFHHDLTLLNIEPPDVFPRVTEHIKEIIEMIKILVEKGYAYEKDGSIYYDVSKFKNYGKLSGIKLGKQKVGTRVAADKYEKEEAQDFALWKKAEKGEEKVGAVWDSPWGRGRPGWHIECSVMAKVHLGETLDIHGGARDLRFPHHENEIAQSEAANGKKFVNYWVHGGLLVVEGQKMSKSLGNYIEFQEIERKGFNPLAFRYLCLTAHYRSEMNFTWAALDAAQRTLDRLYSEVSTWDPPEVGCGQYDQGFLKAINDDLDLPKVLTLVWRLVKDKQFPTSAKHRTLLEMDKVLGLAVDQVEHLEIPDEVKRLVAEREQLRSDDNWLEADEIRDQLEQKGYLLEDTPEGTIVKKSH
ncbi:cysteine--tRNA ligase [candidate division WWE3 bacterium CG_4_9_14_0_2_um_filter_48_10]|uniref:Cysteine--tRNA ligase n=1 Tax=candidate division WWE3 bacterium CG_4_9_14_0_2_um_filter_48_10 TaxID=1975078 RepID=A0A2M8EIW0_UNCKA|nr:MAG: cysteine--tRNA ligase [candidate division WWE3 bacterium CG_4_9_14_0_2_um_filter_48_10]